jgi:hypothetical protein
MISLMLFSPAYRTFFATSSMANGCGSMAHIRPLSPANPAAGMVKKPVPQLTSKTFCPE